MEDKFRLFTPIVLPLILLVTFLCGIIFYLDVRLFYWGAATSLLVFALVFLRLRSLNSRARDLLGEVAGAVKYAVGDAYLELPTPTLSVVGGEIVWYNDVCTRDVFGERDMRGEKIAELFPGVDATVTSPPQGYSVEYDSKKYTLFVAVAFPDGKLASVLYMVDDTQLKYYADEYHKSRPSVALLAVDNYEALAQEYKDAERAHLMTEVEGAVEKYISQNNGFVTKLARDRFIAVVEARGVDKILADKFGLLGAVRKLAHSHRMPPTLSIGVSLEGKSLAQAEVSARQAVDMCLGRGGDQAAVKTSDGYEFYGGLSKAVEKRTKVKTRIIAGALSELIESSSNVVIMGHRFADLDSLGAAVGMLKAVRSMGKQSGICINREKNLVQPLLERLLADGQYNDGDFLSPEETLQLIGSQTLLVIVDTHLPHVLESEQAYKAAKNVVVIDHHRKMVGHIEEAVIFYHEPYASSACEMVAELVQYFPGVPALSKLDAEAMMAGIMLDTKNFMMRTGVRTFEAAAWLRRLGADTVEVRKLFASSMEAYRHKAKVISGAEIYRDFAIAVSYESFDEIKIVAPQAADELVTISGVSASFVVFPHGRLINISGRSMGGVNVQLVMEKLGGGGHQTMAAAQFPEEDVTVEQAYQKLISAIDGYYADITHEEQIATE